MRINGLIFDMDGVLWKGTEPIVDLEYVFNSLSINNIPFVFATNNSTKTVDQYLSKITKFGISIDRSQIFTASTALGYYLKKHYPSGSSFYVIGEDGVYDQLERSGFKVSDEPDGAVIAGLDRSITYQSLTKAGYLIQKGLPFIGTNPDMSFPTPQGREPGAGAILAAIEATAGVMPTIMGKPGRIIFDQAINQFGLPASEILMVGDRLETDILGGRDAGCKTCLVMSGITTPEILAESDIEPDIFFSTIMELIPKVQNGYLNL